jgi:molecular chaperone GrpE
MKVDDLKNKYLRALADYQNLEKQTQVWKEEFVKFSNQNLIIQLLEVLDDLEKAQDHLKDEGLKIAVDKLKTILKNNGLEEIECLGNDFDPSVGEVIEIVPGQEDHKIVKVISKGYKLNGKIIRPAKVTVTKK